MRSSHARTASMVGLASAGWFGLISLALGAEPAEPRLPASVQTAVLAAHAKAYLSNGAAGRPGQNREFDAVSGLLVLDPQRLQVVDGHLQWTCSARASLRPAQKSAALDGLEALLVRMLSEPAGTTPALATVAQARAWVAASEIGLDIPRPVATPAMLDGQIVRKAVALYWAALRDAQRTRPTNDFQRLKKLVNVDADFDGDPSETFSVWYQDHELLWCIAPRDSKEYVKRYDQFVERATGGREPKSEKAAQAQAKAIVRAIEDFETQYFASVREPLISIARNALSKQVLPEIGGPLLTEEDARSIRITISGPSLYVGASAPGQEALRAAPNKGAVDRAIRALTRAQATAVDAPPPTPDFGGDGGDAAPPKYEDNLVVDTGGFRGATVNALQFSPDGRWLAAAGDVVRIWNVESGLPVNTIYWKRPPGGATAASSLVFSPDTALDRSRLLVSATNLPTSMFIYDLGELGGPRDEIKTRELGPIDKLALSRDGRWLVTANTDQLAHVWDWPRRQRLRSFKFQQPIDYLGFPDGGSVCVAITVQGACARLSAERTGAAGQGPDLERMFGAIAWPHGGAPHPFALTFALDRRLIVAGGHSRRGEPAADEYWCGAWRADPAGRGSSAPVALHEHKYYVTATAVSPDGAWVASADGLGEIHVWSAVDGHVRQQFVSRAQPVYAVAIEKQDSGYQLSMGRSPNSAAQWRANHYGTITEQFDLRSRALRPVTPQDAPSPPLALGDMQISVRADLNPRTLEVRSGGRLQSSLPFSSTERWWPLCYGFVGAGRPGGPLVVLGAEDGSLDCLEPGQLLGRRHFFGHTDRVWSVSESSDGRLLVSGSGDGVVRVWSLDKLRDAGNLAAYVETSGRIFHVIPNTPTATAGVQPGDRVLTLDGKPITDLAQSALREGWPFASGVVAHVGLTKRDGAAAESDVELSNMGDMVRPLLSLLVDREGRDWAIWTPEGFYDASPGGGRFIGWLKHHLDGSGATYVAADQLRDVMHRPDVIDLALETGDVGEALAEADRRRGGGPEPEPKPVDQAGMLPTPPAVMILSPPDDLRTAKDTVRIEAEVVRRPPLPFAGGAAPPLPVAPMAPPPPGPAPAADRSAAAPAALEPSARKSAAPRVVALVNGAPIEAREVRLAKPLAPGQEAPADSEFVEYRAEIDVPIRRGMTMISVIAEDQGVSSKAEDAAINVIGRGRAKSRPRLWTVSVGVSRYAAKEKDLKFADRDAESFDRVCREQRDGIYEQVEAELLTNERATKDGVMKAFASVVKQAAPGDWVFVFMAGHGVYDKNGEYYFATHDLDPGSIWSSCLPWTDLTRFRRSLEGRNVVLFVDTCHSADVTGALRARNDPFDFSQSAGCIVYAACLTRQASLEGAEFGGHGAFTKALLDTLSAPGGGAGNEMVTVLGVATDLEKRVIDLTHRRQIPAFGGSLSIQNGPLFRRVALEAP